MNMSISEYVTTTLNSWWNGAENPPCEKMVSKNLIKVDFLLQKLDDLRVLRSSCSDSFEGDFRVHLPEREWDEIQKLVKEMRENK